MQCLTCLQAGKVSLYEGESGKNGFSRGLLHLDALRLEDEKNAHWKHCQLEHNSIQAEFKMTVLWSFAGFFERQVNETVRIAIFQGDLIPNGKSEWQQAPLVRVGYS